MVALLTSFTSDEIDLQFKATYLTDSVNRKLAGIVPVGVYRGFVLTTSPTTDNVRMDVDPSGNDHVAVVENVSNRSVSIRRTGGSFDVDLSALRASPDTYVLAIWAQYEAGKNTGATIRAYTEAEYDAAGEKDTLIVLGRVVIASGTPGLIPDSDLSDRGRISAWTQMQPEQAQWIPLIQNGGFENADTTPHRAQIPYWVVSEDTVTTGGRWLASRTAANVNSDFVGLTLEALTTSISPAATAYQEVGYYVKEGHRVRVRFRYKVLQITTGGPGVDFRLEWRADAGGVTNEIITLDTSATTAGFVDVEEVFECPANFMYLEGIQFRAGAVTTVAGTGDVLAIDDMQVWAESLGLEERTAPQVDGMHEVREIRIVNGIRTSRGNDPILRYASGDLQLDSALSTQTPAGLRLKGSIVEMGGDLLDTLADQTRSRLIAEYQDTEDTTEGDTLTLMQEYPGTGGEPAVRVYVDDTGNLIQTFNAYYSALDTWTRDSSDRESAKSTLSPDGAWLREHAVANNGTGLVWGSTLVNINTGPQFVAGISEAWFTEASEDTFDGSAPWTGDFDPGGASGIIRVAATSPVIANLRSVGAVVYCRIESGVWQGWYRINGVATGASYFDYTLIRLNNATPNFGASGTVSVRFYMGVAIGAEGGFGHGVHVATPTDFSTSFISYMPNPNTGAHLRCREENGSTVMSVDAGGAISTIAEMEADSYTYYFPNTRWFEIDIAKGHAKEGSSFWEFKTNSTQAYWACQGGTANDRLLIPVDIPDGSVIRDVEVAIAPGSATNITLALTSYFTDWDIAAATPTRTSHDASTTSASGIQFKAIAISPDVTMDRTSTRYYVEIDGNVSSTEVYAVRISATINSPAYPVAPA